MLTHRFYYALKPFLPWDVRIGIRRFLAGQQARFSVRKLWPIDESAATTPRNWPGWPDGKKFAFVLTHDVEGPEGLAKCRQLAELEMEMGFRSCFNFVPEGTYKVPPELLARGCWKTASRSAFTTSSMTAAFLPRARASFARGGRINQYLREWGAKGFRAGFMLRNLDWLHDLDIQYDCSTFDTDPFEPQSDGAGTIFPYWLAPPAGTPRSGLCRSCPTPCRKTRPSFSCRVSRSPKVWLRQARLGCEQRRHGAGEHPSGLCLF